VVTKGVNTKPGLVEPGPRGCCEPLAHPVGVDRLPGRLPGRLVGHLCPPCDDAVEHEEL